MNLRCHYSLCEVVGFHPSSVSFNIMASPLTESSEGFSSTEMAEMKSTFDRFDGDKSGHLDAHSLTMALSAMGYEYNEQFVVGVLELVFEAEWETKRASLCFDDFMDFVAEFDPVHNEVVDKMEQKLGQKKMGWIKVDDPRITDLLKHIEMQNGSLSFHGVDAHLDALKVATAKNTAAVPPDPQSASPSTPKPPPLSTVAEDGGDEVDGDGVTASTSTTAEQSVSGGVDLAETHPLDLLRAKEQRLEMMPMGSRQIVEWLNTDKAFQTTMARNECIEIVGQRQWSGLDLISNLRSDRIDDVVAQFGSFQNYQYLIQSLCAVKVWHFVILLFCGSTLSAFAVNSHWTWTAVSC